MGTVDGLVLNCRRSIGPGRTWVFLHGFSDSGSTWIRLAERMPDADGIVLIDARNHGLSGRGVGGHSHHVSDVIAVVEQLDLRSPIMVGHSIGATTAMGVAAERPDLLGRLVMLDPPWRSDPNVSPDPARTAALRREIRALAASSPGLLLAKAKIQHPDWAAADYPAWVQSKREVGVEAVDDLVAVPWRPLVDGLTVPCLLVHGDQERGGIVTDVVARDVKVLARDATVRHVPGRGHHLHREDLDEAVKLLTSVSVLAPDGG